MPLPSPKKQESKDDFISRCMSNNVMKKEFPEQDQRLGVCHTRWDEKKKSLSILPRIYGRVWAIVPDELRAMAASGDKTYSEADFEAYRTSQSARFKDIKGKIALLPLYGVLTPKLSILGMLFGGMSLDMFGEAFDELVADKDVGAIVIDVDSPGGSVYGVHELAEKIYNARGKKPIIASVNGLAASAAYWVASAADEIVVTPSGEVGSIGVYATHMDVSEAEKKIGIKTTLVSAGKYKTEGNPHEPLSKEGLEAIQERVDDYYNTMTADIARNRGVSALKVRSGFGEGRVVGASQGKEEGMVDKVMTLEQVHKMLHPPTRNKMAANRDAINKWKAQNGTAQEKQDA